jgi:DNA-binding transcriptional LysR family regulator
MEALLDATVAGLGVAILPKVSCGPAVADGRLVVLLPGVAPPPVPIWVSRPAGRFLAPAVRVFVDHVREAFPRIAGW